MAAPPSSFASAAKSPNPISTLGAAATTRSKAIEKLEKLKSQRDKQEVLLDMPQMLKKLPDKGKSIVTRIDALNQEIATLEAEAYAKHGVGTKPTTPKPAAMAALDAHVARRRASADSLRVRGQSEETPRAVSGGAALDRGIRRVGLALHLGDGRGEPRGINRGDNRIGIPRAVCRDSAGDIAHARRLGDRPRRARMGFRRRRARRRGTPGWEWID